MKYAALKKTDIANGRGVRVSLWVSGCDRHCPGCFNPEAQDFDYGSEFTLDTLADIMSSLEKSFISGLTLLGGEPMAKRNQPVILNIVQSVKQRFPDKDIWLYSGYKYEQIADNEILKYVDVLVDGEFIESKKSITLRFRGSSNQRIIDLNRTRATGTLNFLDV